VEPELQPEPEPEVIDSLYVGFNIYYLENEVLTSYDVFDTNLSELKLKEKPFV
jgi:hypothetical protein